VVDLEKLLRSPGTVASADADASAKPSREGEAAPALSFRSLQAEPEAKRGSVGKWVVVIVLGVLAALGGLRGKAMMESAEKLPPPPRIAAPKPPEFAMERAPANPATNSTERSATGAPAPAAEPKHAEAKPAPATPSAPATEKPSTASPTPAPARSHAREQERAAASAALLRREGTPGNRASQQPARPGISVDAQQRAEKALEETAAAAGDNASTYLWVGRYAIEDRAQKAAKKIQDLGLPVTVIPRHNATGDFYLVVTGPFGGQRVASVTQWLETQGFPNVHPFKVPGAGQKAVP
jgi:type IV secretory pathway VirB10-like protein